MLPMQVLLGVLTRFCWNGRGLFINWYTRLVEWSLTYKRRTLIANIQELLAYLLVYLLLNIVYRNILIPRSQTACVQTEEPNVDCSSPEQVRSTACHSPPQYCRLQDSDNDREGNCISCESNSRNSRPWSLSQWVILNFIYDVISANITDVECVSTS